MTAIVQLYTNLYVNAKKCLIMADESVQRRDNDCDGFYYGAIAKLVENVN